MEMTSWANASRARVSPRRRCGGVVVRSGAVSGMAEPTLWAGKGFVGVSMWGGKRGGVGRAGGGGWAGGVAQLPVPYAAASASEACHTGLSK
ncbi:hypothetical protein GCM10010278_85830 [Streptomyces melanogenes]|nr:hypothetical protein GCM10010278_85830 [Streptomyces melanogenes]